MAEGLPTTEVEAAFEAIVKEYGRFLRNTIAQVCPKDLGIQIDDIEQQARLRLWRELQSETILTDAASYIYRIAVTTTIDAVRRVVARREEQLRLAAEGHEEIQPEVSSLAVDSERSPDRLAERHHLILKAEAAIARLPENRRVAVEFYLEGMTSHEIADLMNWSEPKARNLVYRGLNDLRKVLRDEGIEYSC